MLLLLLCLAGRFWGRTYLILASINTCDFRKGFSLVETERMKAQGQGIICFTRILWGFYLKHCLLL